MPTFPVVSLRSLCLLLALVPTLAFAAAEDSGLEIKRVFTGWRDAASFKRISEYFNGKENTGGEAVLRTHPEERGGFYFLVRVGNSGQPRAVQAHLQVINAAKAEPARYDFKTELKSGDTVFHLGLTGSDWLDPRANPVAWKLELTDADGTVLATDRSYLWEKPAAKK